MKKFLLPALFLSFFLQAALSQSIDRIAGWSFKESKDFSVLSPDAGGNSNRSFTYLVGNIQTSSLPAQEWFLQTIAADIQKEKWTEPKKGALKETNDVYVYVTEITDASLSKWYLLYIGHQFAGNHVRLARIISTRDADYFQENGGTASRHFGSLAAKDKKTPATAITKKEEAPATKTIINTDVKVKTAVKGIPASAIHSVIMHQEYEVGMGGGIFPVYNPYVLFKDGNIYKYPELSLDDVNMQQSKLSEPKQWGTWKNSGTNLITYWPAEKKAAEQQETWKKESFYITVPAKKGETITGRFKSIGGGGNTALGGDVMIAVYSNIILNEQGKFILDKGAGISGSDIWETHSGKTNDAGFYKLDGYSIEMKYNSGKTEKRFFYFYPDSKKHFSIGGTVYIPKK